MARLMSSNSSGNIVRTSGLCLYNLSRVLLTYRWDGLEKSVLFVTNNATKSRVNYKKKFDSLGVEAHVVCQPCICFIKRWIVLKLIVNFDRMKSMGLRMLRRCIYPQS